MTNPEISEAAKARRVELVQLEYQREPANNALAAIRLAFDRHIQATSDKARPWAALLKDSDPSIAEDIAQSLILPDPKDPLVEIMDSFLLGTETWQLAEAHAEKFLAELAKRGGKITFD